MYSARFRKGASDSKAWRAHREEISFREDSGRLGIGLRSIVRCGEYAVLAVDQDCPASTQAAALKRLFLIREDGVWKIIAVDWPRSPRFFDQKKQFGGSPACAGGAPKRMKTDWDPIPLPAP
jgi:hypothetical protein